MSDERRHIDPKHDLPPRELLERYLLGETTDEENARVVALIEQRPDVRAALAEIQRLRDTVHRAVKQEQVPADLRSSVLKSLPGFSSTEAIAGARAGTTPHQRVASRYRWVYALAALLVLVPIVWFVFLSERNDADEPVVAGSEIENNDSEKKPGDAIDADVVEVLKIGMTDHIKCAVTYYKGEIPEASAETMKLKLGKEFAGLVPLVQNAIREQRLVVGHKCSFDGREYVHFILKGDESMTSIAITPRRATDTQLSPLGGAATAVEGVPIHETTLDDFAIAGFDAGEYYVFVASNLSAEENIRLASALLPQVSGFLRDKAVAT